MKQLMKFLPSARQTVQVGVAVLCLEVAGRLVMGKGILQAAEDGVAGLLGRG